MIRPYSVVGNIACDFHCESSFRVNGNHVDFPQVCPPLSMETRTPIFVGGKLMLKEPLTHTELSNLRVTVVPGGGGLGTISSLSRRVFSAIQYIDASMPLEMFTRYLNTINVNYHFLRLRKPPNNLVLGCRSNKIILKSPVHSVTISPMVHEKIVSFLTGSEWIILNSVKDPTIANAAIEAVAKTPHCKLAGVLTTSLAPEFLLRSILPVAHLLIVSFDELDWLLPNRCADISSSRARLLRLFQAVPVNLSLFITMGRAGVLCGCRDGFFHVRLKNEVAQQVDSLISKCPAAITGAGDFLSGAIIANRCACRWFLRPSYPQIVQDAIVGSIAAIEHLGQQVNGNDFVIREDVWCESDYFAA